MSSVVAKGMRQRLSAWWIAGPGPDERLSSVVHRAALQYGTTSECLLGELLGDGHPAIADVDSAGAHVVAAIARAIQIEPRELWRCRLADHPRLLAPAARWAYCPDCWKDDDAEGRPRGFRREWAGVFRTFCRRHGSPLRLYDPMFHSFGTFLRYANCQDSEIQDRRRAIDHFAQALEASLFDNEAWPVAWADSAQHCRSKILSVSLNLGTRPAFPSICSLIDPSELPGEMTVPSHMLAPFNGALWEGVRAICDPALRRAVLWIVGSWTCPTWDDRWRPSWTSDYPAPVILRELLSRQV